MTAAAPSEGSYWNAQLRYAPPAPDSRVATRRNRAWHSSPSRLALGHDQHTSLTIIFTCDGYKVTPNVAQASRLHGLGIGYPFLVPTRCVGTRKLRAAESIRSVSTILNLQGYVGTGYRTTTRLPRPAPEILGLWPQTRVLPQDLVVLVEPDDLADGGEVDAPPG